MDRCLDIFDPLPPLWTISLNKAYVVTWTFGKLPLPPAYPHGLWMPPYQYDIWIILSNPQWSQVYICVVFFQFFVPPFWLTFKNKSSFLNFSLASNQICAYNYIKYRRWNLESVRNLIFEKKIESSVRNIWLFFWITLFF